MEIRESIEKTINYAQNYRCKLNREELKDRLISNTVYSHKIIDLFLDNNKDLENKLALENKNKWIGAKLKKVEYLAKLIENKFSDILFLGITGSVAAGHPKKNDDIDILIITKKNKLWLTRLILRFFVLIKKIPHRKYGVKEKSDEFCFNLWLDEENLTLPKIRQNLRCSMDLILMKPILNKKNTYEKFLMANSWVEKFVASGYSNKVKKINKPEYLVKEKNNTFSNTVNLLLFLPQYVFMKKKIKNGEIVSPGFAFFNKSS